ncbi:MAG: hypothetical protein K1X64_09045 [Myxococcaceae bacterium]|nr:hypothetical protein [Myxococcaceae bacterium]
MPSLRRPSRRQKLPSRIDVLKAYGSYAFHNALTWLRRAPAEGFSRRVPLTKSQTGGFEYAALVSTQQPSLLVFERRRGKSAQPRYSLPLDWKQLPVFEPRPSHDEV